jgi:hypothetical protein
MALRPLDPTIVNAYQAPKFNMPDPLQDVAALEQIKSGRVARQINEQQLAQLQQDRLALDEMQKRIEAAGGPSNLKSAFTEMINSKLPKYAEIGYAGLQKIKEQEDFQSLISPKAPLPTAEPTVATGPISRPSLQVMPVDAPRNALATPETDRQNQLAAMTAQQAQPSLPTNMLAADLDQLDRQIQGAYALGTPRALAYAKALEARRDEVNKNIVVSPGATVFQGGKPVYTAPEKSESQPSLVREYNFAKTQEGGGFKGSYQDFVVARSAATRPPAQPLAPVPALDKTTNQVVYATREQILQNPGRFVPVSEKQEPGVVANTVTDEAGNVRQYNRYGEQIGETKAGAGKPSASFTKLRDQRAQLGRDLGAAITELTDITKDGGLIDQSTGSGVGRLVDVGKGFFGGTTPGAIATAKLKPIQDLVLKTIPRFEGPQSDKDTQSYKEAAGQLADPNMPTAIRKEAAKTVLRLMTARKNQFVTPEMAAEGAGASGGGVKFLGFEP